VHLTRLLFVRGTASTSVFLKTLLTEKP